MKRIAILGSTGSIGQQTLQVLDKLRDKYDVCALTAHKNERLLSKQAEKYSAEYVGLSSSDPACLKKALEVGKGIDIAVIASKGIESLDAFLFAIDKNIDVALANKELLVCAGELVKERLRHSKSRLLPIDSEHNAIWQCLGNKRAQELILTASGGSFYDLAEEELACVTPTQAERHPNWKMGKDITMDSNTMFNKTMEVLEARWLFDVPINNIKMLVHRQSLAHAFVRFADGSLLGQFCAPDMRLPIMYALTYPYRSANDYAKVDMASIGSLTFSEVDSKRFPCSQLCYDEVCNTRLMSTAMVAANAACRQLFRSGKIFFTDFYTIIKGTCEKLFGAFATMPITDYKIRNCYDYVYKYTTNNFGSIK